VSWEFNFAQRKNKSYSEEEDEKLLPFNYNSFRVDFENFAVVDLKGGACFKKIFTFKLNPVSSLE
jgi:hypothetical protein